MPAGDDAGDRLRAATPGLWYPRVVFNKRSRGITGVIVVAFVLRLGWALLQPRTPEALARLPDQEEYLSLGQNLLHHGELNFIDARFNQTIWAYRMPGYPALIAACGGSLLAVRLVQAVLDTSSVIAVYLICTTLSERYKNKIPETENAEIENGVGHRFRHLPRDTTLKATALKNGVGHRFSDCWALCTAGVLAMNPFYIYFTGLILSETCFSCSMVWSLLFFVRQRIFTGSLILIAGTYFRPAGVFLLPPLAIIAVSNLSPRATYQLTHAFTRACAFAVIAGLLAVVTLFPWAYRNHQRLGTWFWLTSNSGITLYDGFHDGASGASDQLFLADLPKVRSMSEVERSRYLTEAASTWASRNLARLPSLSMSKLRRSWSPVPLSSEFGRPFYRAVSGLYAVPFDLLVIVGLFSSVVSRRVKLLLVMPAISLSLIQILSVGSIRYRVPAEAPLAVIAGLGCVTVHALLLSRRKTAAVVS